MFGIEALIPFLSMALTSVAPYLTEAVKNGANALGVKVPGVVKSVVNVAVSAVVAGLAGSIFGAGPEAAVLGTGAGIASTAGFKVGKRS